MIDVVAGTEWESGDNKVRVTDVSYHVFGPMIETSDGKRWELQCFLNNWSRVDEPREIGTVEEAGEQHAE